MRHIHYATWLIQGISVRRVLLLLLQEAIPAVGRDEVPNPAIAYSRAAAFSSATRWNARSTGLFHQGREPFKRLLYGRDPVLPVPHDVADRLGGSGAVEHRGDNCLVAVWLKLEALGESPRRADWRPGEFDDRRAILRDM